MTYERGTGTAHSNWDASVIPGESLHLCGIVDALKQIENNLNWLEQRGIDGGLGNKRHTFNSLYQQAQQLTLKVSPHDEETSKVVRLAVDDLRSIVGVSVFDWQEHGGVKHYSKTLIDELRDAVGLIHAEQDMATSPGTTEGGVIKEFGPVAYRWPIKSEAEGAPRRASSWCGKRILKFAGETRRSDVETWLVWKHGGGGGCTETQTMRIRLGGYSPESADATYNAAGMIFATGISTSWSIVGPLFTQLPNYPSNGDDPVYCFVEMENDEGPVDQGNVFPMFGGADVPEVYLWQPGG